MEKKKQLLRFVEILISIFVFIIVITIIVGIVLLMLGQLSPSSICENICKHDNGSFWMMTDCNGSQMECSGFCVEGNQTIMCKDILNNITTAE